MVDSTPTRVGPPSMMRSMRPPRSASTCCAVVGETWPERFAEGATTGLAEGAQAARAPPDDRARAPRWCRAPPSQARRPGNQASCGSTSVSGPGQNASASRAAAASKRARRRAAARIRNMRDQRIEGRPALGRIEPRHRRAVRRVRAEPVDGLGREGDQTARRQHAHRRGRSAQHRRRHARLDFGASSPDDRCIAS